MELQDQDSAAFDDILTFLETHPGLEKLELSEEPALSLPGLKIYPDRRKAYCNQTEVHLTVKEYDLLCLLAANKGRVLTYAQIYERIWGEEALGNERNAVGCHIRDLRGKLREASPEAPFAIRCVREIGHCFEINPEVS